MPSTQLAIIGAGFWANFQTAAWRELPDLTLLAICDRDRLKAEAVATRHGILNVYESLDELLDNHAHELDFVDIITDVDAHPALVAKAAERGLDVICQKPMGPSLEAARQMVETCQRAGVRLYIHENFRWQTPIRQLRAVLDSGVIGTPFKANVSFYSSFPVFDNQPFLADLEQFILTDIGSHVLDICRFLFGEATSLDCQTTRVNPAIRGKDVATVLMAMQGGLVCHIAMSYASIMEHEVFPQTLITVEGSMGSVSVNRDFEIRATTRQTDGHRATNAQTAIPPVYDWAGPAYALVHASIVDCNRNLLHDL